jgi:hypothetical protein
VRLFGWFRSPVPRQRPLTPNALKRQQLRDLMRGMTPPRYRPEWAKPDARYDARRIA